LIPDHIKKTNLNPEILTSSKQIAIPSIIKRSNWTEEYPFEELKEEELFT